MGLPAATAARSRTTVMLPQLALDLITELLTELGQGHAVTVETVQAELTPEQAAEVLRVDCSYLTNLLDKGEIPYREVENNRQISGRVALFLRDLLRANGSLSKPVLLSSRNESGEPTAAELPQLAVQLLADLLNKLGEGHAVAVETVQDDLTPGQAAEVLGVDRSYLMDLLDKSKIPYRRKATAPKFP